MKSFLVLIDFENLSIKTTIKNFKSILISKNPIILNNVPALNFEDYNGIIITNCEVYNFDEIYLIYRGNYEIEYVLKAYFENKLKELNETYFGIIFDKKENVLIVFGNFFFYKEKYKEKFFIFNNFELFYKLSDIVFSIEDVLSFINGKSLILEIENKKIIINLNDFQIYFESLNSLNRKVFFKKLKSKPKIVNFYYYIEPSDLAIFELFKNEKLPINIHSLYQFENIYNSEFNLDFEKIIRTKLNLREFIVSNYENFYNAYNFFKLDKFLFRLIFKPIIIYRTFIIFNIIRNFRL